MQSTWVAANSTMAEKYGGSFLRQQSASPESAGGMSELASATPPTASSGISSAFDTSHGLMAVAVLAAVSIGLMAFSTTVRVGHAEAHAGVGTV